MFNSLHARILFTVVSIIIITVAGIAYLVQKQTIQALSQTQDENAGNLLNAVVLSVENEYNSLLFHKETALEIRKNERKHIVSVVMAMLDQLNNRQRSKEITLSQAQESAKTIIKKMRYDNGVGYLWINNMERPIPRMVMHPTLPHLDHTILDDPRFNCALGKQQNLFQAFVDACLVKGEGFVDYLWPKPVGKGLTEDQEKISYAALFKPWNWVIGTGVYIEDIAEDAQKRRLAILDELRQTFARVRTTTNGYLFIFNGEQKMLVHPTLTEDAGQGLVNPASGKPIMDDLMTASRTPEKVFEYIWDKPGHKGEYRFKKRAYIRYFEPLDWYIGSSLYVDEIELPTRELEKTIFYLALAGIALALIISTLVAKSLTTPLGKLMAHVAVIEEKGIDQAGILPESGTIETRTFAHILNRMVSSVQQVLREKGRLVGELKDARGLLEQRVEERTSELEAANHALRAAKEKAEIANKAKSHFLANMSHEIRTPMNAVLGFSEILEEKIKNPELAHYIASIRSSGRALLSLINDILDLSKVEAGKLELNWGPVDIRELFSEMETLFDRKIRKKGLKLEIDIAKDLPRAVLLDKTRLRQILVNLLGNAVKFTDKGYISLSADVAFVAYASRSLLDLTIHVKDTGIGMSPDESERIFNAFEQLKPGSSKGGTGLGLAITRRLTQMMRGRVSVTSSLDRGSCFELRFREVEVAALAELEIDSRMDTLPRNLNFKKAEILVTDDIPYNRDLIKTYLDRYNFSFTEAENGREMLEKAGEQQPDLILLDMKMPVMDGYAASEALRDMPEIRETPIIAITASAMKEDEEKILALCNSYLKKPVSRGDLIQEIMKYLPHEISETDRRTRDGSQSTLPAPELEASALKGAAAAMADPCRRLLTGMAIDEIENFAMDLEAMGKTEKKKELAEWAGRLHGAALRFDLDRIKEMLTQFLSLAEENGNNSEGENP